jgi:hypothetical protein
MQDLIENAIDEGPGRCRVNETDGPLLPAKDLKLDKGAQGHTDGKTERPDCDEVARDPAKHAGHPSIRNTSRQVRFCPPGAAIAVFVRPQEVHDELDDGDRFCFIQRPLVNGPSCRMNRSAVLESCSCTLVYPIIFQEFKRRETFGQGAKIPSFRSEKLKH